MAIPSDPTVDSVITDGMIEGGQYTIVSGGLAETAFKNSQFQTIKTELWAACKTDKLLETETLLVASAFTSLLTLPADFDSEIRLTLFDADVTYRGTAQAGGAATITLASTFTADPTAIEGRYIFTLSGTGSGQFAQILSYNDTTKVITVTANWTTPPDSTTTYLVQQIQMELTRLDYKLANYPNTRPRWYDRLGTNIYVYPAPDQNYPILLQYRPNLTRLDEAGAVLVKHLRERRSLWIAGIKAKTGARFDDEREGTWSAQWEAAKLSYMADNVVYDQMESHR